MDYKTAVQATLNGDEDGFLYLYESTYSGMYQKAYAYMKNEYDAEDVLQDSYMKAKRSLDKLSDPDKFPSWLGCIVANTSKNYLKKKKPLLFLDIDDEDEEVDFYDIEDDDDFFQPEESYSDKEVSEILRKLIDSLSDEQRLCILMYHFDERTIRDIAETMSCSENTVKSRLNYGRKALRKKVEAMQNDGYRFFGAAPIPMLKHFMARERETSDFIKTSKAAMESSKAAMIPQAETAVNGATVAVVKNTASKKLVAICVSAAVIGGGALTALAVSNNNGFVNFINRWKNDNNYVKSDNVQSEYLNYIAGTPTADEFAAILEALPDSYSYEILKASDYTGLTEFFCHKIKDDSVDNSALTSGGDYKVDEINRWFSVFSNYIISSDNYEGKSYNKSSDGDTIECDYSTDYANAEIEIINVSLDDETKVMTVRFTRTFNKTSENEYALSNEEYSNGTRDAVLQPDYNGDYRITYVYDN